jgi:hypothetical protein
MHLWLYDGNCKLIGVLDNVTYTSGLNQKPMSSELKYMTMYRIHPSYAPWMTYADQDHWPRSYGWELYFPTDDIYGQWYWYRYFDCYRP